MTARALRFCFVVSTGFLSTSSVASAAAKFVAGPVTTASALPHAVAVSNGGVAIGSAGATFEGRSYRWSETAVDQLLKPSNRVSWTIAPTSMNASGIIVGGVSPLMDTNRGQPVVWAASATASVELSRETASGSLGSGSTDAGFAYHITDAGSIIGSLKKRDANGALLGTVGVRWPTPTSAPQELEGFAFATTAPLGHTFATIQTESGIAFGFGMHHDTINQRDGASSAIRWAAGSATAERLEALSPTVIDAYTRPRDANVHDVAVGISELYNGTKTLGFRSVKWNPDGVAATRLATLRPRFDGYVNATAELINDEGTIVGTSEKYAPGGQYTSGYFAVRWEAGGTAVTELGTLGPGIGGPSATPLALNNVGTTVGVSQLWNGSQIELRATMWRAHETAAIDLNSLLSPELLANWTLSTPDKISDTGWIAGTGMYDADGAAGPGVATRRFFSMLLPEAGTYGMGDANFDTKIDFKDLVVLAQHYNESNLAKAVNVGDFNLDGGIDFLDLVSLAQNYGYGTTTPASAFAADWALAQAVPEPAAIVLVGLPVALMRRSRRSSR